MGAKVRVRARVRVRVRARVLVRVRVVGARDGEVEVGEEVVAATVVELALEVDPVHGKARTRE